MYYQGMTVRYLPGLFIPERALRASQQFTVTQTPGWQSNAHGVIRTSRAGGLTGLIILAG